MSVAAKARRSGGRARSDDAAAKAPERRATPTTGQPPVSQPMQLRPDAQPMIAEPEPPAVLSTQDVHDALATNIGTRIDPASMIFDGDWYRKKYPDVAAAKLDPVRHYFDDGFREGRNPNRYFDTVWYANSNPDVAAARLNPFLHYLLYGAVEGRKPAP